MTFPERASALAPGGNDGGVSVLRSPATIRERCANVLAAADAGRTAHLAVDRSKLDACAAIVADVTRRRYPSLAIPYHSRWRHFEAGGVDRAAELDRALVGRGATDAALARIDLAIVSVLLDAGAGARWSYVERETGGRYARSEGLGVASFRAFVSGAFSSTPGDPCRVDARALGAIDGAALARIFQATDANPLVGLDGRASLLRRLAAEVAGRPSAPFLPLLERRGDVAAAEILAILLERTSAIWPNGLVLGGVALGDAWPHPRAGGSGVSAGYVPFHQLSQWLAYSLFEPFERAGHRVVDRDALTALPEYRNGGLLLDTGVLALRDPADATRRHAVGSELVVEWRALTVALVDELAAHVRSRLGRPELPLACVLEGGTWAAGRETAAKLRGGEPPLAIESDGTVF
ncbi:MAG: DUF1688 family protein [Betaproteobacteria bacterium]|nr:DUF1688 family protein [Betaproteobacteria bacterium]